jgi:hypothetical protein
MSICFHLISKCNRIRIRPETISLLNSQVNSFPCSNKSIIASNNSIVARYFSDDTKENENVAYEGPFAPLALRLKRVSISTAALSIVGIPLILVAGSNVPASGQIAVGGTAILAATGSTAALSFCFNPYIHKLEWVNDGEESEESEGMKESRKMLLKATTRNFFSMPVETVFDPDVDVIHNPKNYRPFCNFMAKGMPFFVHPHLVKDDELRIKLVGKEKGILLDDSAKEDGKKKDPDDDFL